MKKHFTSGSSNAWSQEKQRGTVYVQWLLSVALIAAGLLWQFWAVAGRPVPAHGDPEVASRSVERAPSPLTTRAIEQIRVGDRVHAENPTGYEDTFLGEVEPATWRQVTLRAPKADGSWAQVVLLRSTHWLEQQHAEIGGRVPISVPECGIDGNGEILDIGPCPRIKHGSGHIVTGTFKHTAAATLEITVSGAVQPIGTTANHPFWSVSRQSFVRAQDLTQGEEVSSLDGVRRIMSITPRDSAEAVYNIEVNQAHVYCVTALGITVHNGNAGLCPRALNGLYTQIRQNVPKYTRTLASAPDGALFLSGAGHVRGNMEAAAIERALGRSYSASSKGRIQEMLTYFKSKGVRVDPDPFDFALLPGIKVDGTFNASHAELQAAYRFFRKAPADQALHLEDGCLVLSIVHPRGEGPCPSCLDLLRVLARENRTPIRVQWIDLRGVVRTTGKIE